MSLCAEQEPRDPSAPVPAPVSAPDGNHTLNNHRLRDNLPAFTLTRDINTSAARDKFVSKLDVWPSFSPPRAKILELLRPEDPCRDTLEAIVRPAQRRGLVRPYDEDTKRFLQKALSTPTLTTIEAETRLSAPEAGKNGDLESELKGDRHISKVRSLAEELEEAEEEERSGANIRRELLREFRRRGGGVREALERERLGRLALAVEEDEAARAQEGGLVGAARRLDALLAESRSLHAELQGIHQDMQAQSVRACRCAAAARTLAAESRALRYLDDVVALLRGDLAAATRVSAWPFALGPRHPDRNYIV